MQNARITSAALVVALAAAGALAIAAPRQDDAALNELRQQQIEDLTRLVRGYEMIVNGQKARAEVGVSNAYDVRSAEIDLLRVKADLARATGDRDAWIAQLRESLAKTEQLVVLQEADARANVIDLSPTAVVDARESLVDLREQLIDALQAE